MHKENTHNVNMGEFYLFFNFLNFRGVKSVFS
jgi:hypothetical protein